MANDTRKYTVQFDIDGSNAVTGLKSVEKEIGKVTSEMEVLEQASKKLNSDYIASVKQYSSLLDTLQGKLEKIYNAPKLGEALKANAATSTLNSYLSKLNEVAAAQDRVLSDKGKTSNRLSELHKYEQEAAALLRLKRIQAEMSAMPTATTVNKVTPLQALINAKTGVTAVTPAEQAAREFQAHALINSNYIASQQAAREAAAKAVQDREAALAAKANEARAAALAKEEAARVKEIAKREALAQKAVDALNLAAQKQEAARIKAAEKEATAAEKAAQKIADAEAKAALKEAKAIEDAAKKVEAARVKAAQQALIARERERAIMDRQQAARYNQYGQYYDNNLATGSSTLNQQRYAQTQYNPNSDRERVDREHEYQNAIREKGARSFEAQNLQYQRDRAALQEQHAATINQNAFRANAGEITHGQRQVLDTAALTQYRTALNALHEPLALAARDTESLFFRVGRAIGAYQIWNLAISSIGNAFRSIIPIGIQLESTIASLTSTIGSDAGASAYLHKLTEEANRTGINLTTLRENFRNFQASTSLAGASLESTWKMFTNLNTVITALHSTGTQAQGIFTAMAQIFNKSKVQSEELVKQLGNLLPGAFASMAASMGIMPEELSHRMKQGLVKAKDVMENFTEYMKNRFTAGFAFAAHSTNAEIGRMQTAWQLLGEKIYSSNKGPLVDVIKNLTSLGNYLAEGVQGTNKLGEAMQLAGTILSGYVIANLVKLVPVLLETKLVTEGIVGLLNPWVAGLTAVAAAYISMYQAAKAPIDRLADAEAERVAALNKSKAEDSSIAPEIRVAESNDYKKQFADIQKLQEDLTTLQRQKRVKDAVKARFGGSLPGGDYVRGIPNEGEVRTDRGKETYDSAIAYTQQQIDDKRGRLSDYTKTQVAAITAHDLETKKLQRQAAGVDVTPDMKAVIDRFDEDHADTLAKAMQSARDRVFRAWKTNPNTSGFDTITEAEHSKDSNIRPTPEALAERDKAYRVRDEDAERAAQEAKETFLNKHKPKGLAAAAAKAKSADYEVTSGTFNEERDSVNKDLQLLESRYSKHLISLNQFFTGKKALLAEDERLTETYLQDQVAKANKYKDPQVRQRVFNQVGKERNQITYRRETAADQETSELSRFQGESDSFEDQVNAIKGGKGNSEIRFYAQQKQRMAALNKEIADRQSPYASQSSKELSNINFIGKSLGANDSIVKVNQDEGVNKAKYDDELEKINRDQARGLLGPVSAAMQLNALQEKYLTTLRETLHLKQEIARTNPDNKNIQNEVTKAEASVDKFKTDITSGLQPITSALSNAVVKPLGALIDGSTNARQAFRSFAIGVQQDIANMVAEELKSVVMRGLIGNSGNNGITGGLLGSIGSGLKGLLGGSTFNGTGPLLTFANAQGGVYSSPSLSAYSNQIVTSPTLFKFAAGAGLMGEAGPEGILPLTKTSKGLGVHALGVNSGGNNAGGGIQIGAMHINVSASQDSTPAQQGAIIGKAVRTQLKTLITGQLSDNMRSGKLLNPTAIQVNM